MSSVASSSKVGTHGGRVAGRRDAGDDVRLEDQPAGHRRVARPVVIVSMVSSCRFSTADTSRTIPGLSLPIRSIVSSAPAPLIGGGIRAGMGGHLEQAVELAQRGRQRSARSAGTVTTTMPANLPASSAIWLCSQLPSWVTTSARA